MKADAITYGSRGGGGVLTFLGQLLRVMGPVRWPVLLFSFGVNLLLLAVPLYMLQVYDRVLSSGKLDTLLWLTVLAGVALGVLALVDHSRDGLLSAAGQWLHRRLGRRTVGACLAAAQKGAAASQQPLQELRVLQAFVGGAGLKTFFDAPFAFLFVGCLFLIHPLFGLLALGAGAVLLVSAVVHARIVAAATREGSKCERRLSRELEHAFGGIEALAAMRFQGAVLDRWEAGQRQTDGVTERAALASSAFVSGSKFFRLSIQIGVLGLGAVLVLQGAISAGAMIAASVLMSRALQPFEQAQGAWRSYAAAREALERLGPLTAFAPQASQHDRLPEARGEVTLEGVVQRAPGQDRAVLGQLTISFKPGTITAVVGPSGAGKTSLCRLLVGIWAPSRGHVRLDGADLALWPDDQCAETIGYLPQDVQLVGLNPREAISRLAADARPEDVYQAAHLAGLHQEILTWEKGYETPIGPGGRFLSAGQRQRLGLARALFRKPKVIVLDEPAANLDAEGERALISALNAARDWNATVIVVTHHMRFLKHADRVVSLREGRVAFDGLPGKLLKLIDPAKAPANGATKTGDPGAPQALVKGAMQ